MQELASPPRASTTVIKCVTSSLEGTYRYIFENCYEVYKRNFEDESTGDQPTTAKTAGGEENPTAAVAGADGKPEEGAEGGGGGENSGRAPAAPSATTTAAMDPEQYGPDCTKNLNFWVHLIQLLEFVIDEDKRVYTQVRLLDDRFF